MPIFNISNNIKEEFHYRYNIPYPIHIYRYAKTVNERRQLLDYMIKFNVLPSLDIIYIETINYCNLACSFCPVGEGQRINKATMSDELFDHILNLIGQITDKSKVTVCMNGHGEPLLDKDIFKRINKLKQFYPQFRTVLFTNTTLIQDRIDELVKSKLDYLMCDFYNEDDKTKCLELFNEYNIAYNKALDYWGNINNRLNVRYSEVYNTDKSFYNNRLGTVNVGPSDVVDEPCIFPFIQLPINVNGGIRYCCIDAMDKTVFDNVLNYNNILELWYSKLYNDIRCNLKDSKLKDTACRQCNNHDYLKFRLIYT